MARSEDCAPASDFSPHQSSISLGRLQDQGSKVPTPPHAFELPDGAEPVLEALDAKLLRAVDDDDEEGYQEAFGELIVTVRQFARPLDGYPGHPSWSSQALAPRPGSFAVC